MKNVGSVNNSFDFYNNGTSYFNGAVTVDDNLTVSDRLTVADTSGADGLVIAGGENTGISARLFFETGTGGQGVSLLNIGGILDFRTGATAGSSSGTQRMQMSTSGLFKRTTVPVILPGRSSLLLRLRTKSPTFTYNLLDYPYNISHARGLVNEILVTICLSFADYF